MIDLRIYSWEEKETAYKIMHAAIRRRIMWPARDCRCWDCGGPAEHYDHFRGYSEENALAVQPVCRPCHRARGFQPKRCFICGRLFTSHWSYQVVCEEHRSHQWQAAMDQKDAKRIKATTITAPPPPAAEREGDG